MSQFVRKFQKRVKAAESEALRAAKAELEKLYAQHSKLGKDALMNDERRFDTEYAAGRASVLRCLIERKRMVMLQKVALDGAFEIRVVTGSGIAVLARGTEDEMKIALDGVIERVKSTGLLAETG